jgi:TrmH family RNA methyltransferase
MIASRENETVKAIRRLRRSKGDHAILEGPHLVRDAIELGLELDPILATPRFLDSDEGKKLTQGTRKRPPKAIKAEILESLTDADAPRGVLAVAKLPRPGLGETVFRKDSIWLYLDKVQDPGNLGALARIAEGLGASGLLLSPGCADPNHPRALRGSAGSLLRIVAIPGVEPEAARDWSGRSSWVGLAAHDGATSWRALKVDRPFVLAVGAEGPGLSEATRAQIGHLVTIPLAGKLESLNVAVAAALVLAELQRER